MSKTSRQQKLATPACDWLMNVDGWYETGCGQAFEFTTDGPRENHFTFCPYCGRHLKAAVQGRADESSHSATV